LARPVAAAKAVPIRFHPCPGMSMPLVADCMDCE
jgi:hypothetical protein